MLRPALALFLILFASVAAADDASDGERIESMGLPPLWKPYAGAMLDLDFQDGTDLGGELLGGVYRDLTNPVIGLGASGEVYGRVVGGDADGGARLMGVVGAFGLKLGGTCRSPTATWTSSCPWTSPCGAAVSSAAGDSSASITSRVAITR